MYCTKMDFSEKILTSNKNKNIPSLSFEKVVGQKILLNIQNYTITIPVCLVIGYEEVLSTGETAIH